MAWAAMALVLSYVATAVAVLLLDPYDVYPWGLHVALPAMDTTENSKFLVAAAAKDPDVDLMMVGSSPSMSYSPDQLQRAFPGARHPWNMSYPAANPRDRALTVETFLKYSHATRYVIWIDWTYALDAGRERELFPDYLYDSNPLNDVKMVNSETLSATADLLRGRGLSAKSAGLARSSKRLYATSYEAFQTPAAMEDLESRIDAHRPLVAGPWRAPCERYTALDRQLVPELKRFAARGIRVDLVFPAYSAAGYFLPNPRGAELMLPEQLNLRRCTVLAVEGLRGISVWAPDADPDRILDLASYKDPTHIYLSGPLMLVLDSIGNRSFRVDSRNVESYLARLRDAVVHYHVHNSRLRIVDGHGP